MDRISKKKTQVAVLAMASSLTALLGSASAGTVLVPPPAPVQVRNQPGEVEHFAESRFGVQPGYAARAVEELESPDEENISLRIGSNSASDRAWKTPAGRSPASIGPESSDSVNDVTRSSMSSTDRDPAQALASDAARNGIQEVALIAGDLGFFPKTVFVSRDVPVRLFVTGSSKNTLCFMMDSFQVRKQIRSQRIEEISFTPNQPGKYRFYCPVNGMEGTLIVKEFANPT